MKDKFKMIASFLCGAVFFSGVSFASGSDLIAKVSNFKIEVNGIEQKLSKKPIVIEGSTYVPVRDIAVVTGFEVGFQNGVISLDNNEASSNSIQSTTAPKNIQNSNDESSLNFIKLPATLEKGGYEVTVTSVASGENSTEIGVTINNKNTTPTTINYDTVMGSNYKVSGLAYSAVGTVQNGENFPKEVKASEIVSGTISKGAVPSGTKNIIFNLRVGSEAFSFYIDVDGQL